jgi:hypothetical protein
LKTADVRLKHDRTRQQLKKLRRRYMAKIKPAIEADHLLLWDFTKKMKERGLYAQTTFERDIRFYILRRMYMVDSREPGTFCWNSWLLEKGWGRSWWRKAA